MMKQLTDNPEETQSSDLTHSRMPRKPRTESPWFWVQLVGGSLVFHGTLLAIALPFSARLSAASQSDPTPVEFVELSESSPPAVNQPSTKSTASITSSSAPATLPPSPSNETIPPSDISFAPEPTPAIPRSPIPSPEPLLPESSPEPSPEISPSSEIQTETPFETAAVPPQPDSLPLPVLPSASPPQPSPEPLVTQQTSEAAPEVLSPEVPTPAPSVPEAPLDRSSDRPQPEFPPTDTTATALPTPASIPQPETLPSAPGLQTTTIDTPVPDVSESIAVAPSTVDSNNLNSANSEAAAPVGVTLSLSSSSQVAPDGNELVETLEVARPSNNSSTFLPDPSASACQVTPDVLNRVGTPITLKITTDNKEGKPMDVGVYQSSGSPDYDQLAACLVREWHFEPATALNADETQRLAIASDKLLITIIINRS